MEVESKLRIQKQRFYSEMGREKRDETGEKLKMQKVK